MTTLRTRIRALEFLPARSLQTHDHNWRHHPQFQQDALAGVLREVGIAGALLVYDSARQGGRVILDGHLRQATAPDEVWPCLVLDVDDAEADYLLATYDPLTALAEAGHDELTRLLHRVSSGEASVQALLADLAVKEGLPLGGEGSAGESGGLADVEPELDRAEELREKWGVEVGQLWRLGNHRVFCEDALSLANITRVLDGEDPDMILADPPYGVSIVATNVPVGGGEAYNIPFGGLKAPRRRTHVGGGQRQKDLTGHYPIESWGKPVRGSVGAAKPFGSQAVRGTDGASHVVAVGKYAPVIGDESPATAIQAATQLLTSYPDAVHVWWGGNYYADYLPASSCWLVWDKDTTGNFADCELAWTNQPKAARLFHHRWNGMLRDSEHERRWHPTQKPAALAAWVFTTLGGIGDMVLDPFLGSGPSLIAAEQLSRVCYACELSPAYVAVSLERWSQLTGQTPERIT